MVLYNLRHVENEREVPLTKGEIQLQSEGAELFYRNIMIESIISLPKNLIN